MKQIQNVYCRVKRWEIIVWHKSMKNVFEFSNFIAKQSTDSLHSWLASTTPVKRKSNIQCNQGPVFFPGSKYAEPVFLDCTWQCTWNQQHFENTTFADDGQHSINARVRDTTIFVECVRLQLFCELLIFCVKYYCVLCDFAICISMHTRTYRHIFYCYD